MKIAEIGASKGTGLFTVRMALERGHRVNALSRSGLGEHIPGRLNDIKGNALDPNDLQKALIDADAVIVTLGTNGKIGNTTLFSEFAWNLLTVHKHHPITVPVIVLTGFGTDETIPYQKWYMRLALRSVLGRVYDDKSVMESLITATDMHWVIVRPWIMDNRPYDGMYRVVYSDFTHYSLFPVPRYNVVDYMLDQAEHPTDIGKTPAIFRR